MAGCVLHFLAQTAQREKSSLESMAFGEMRDQGTQAALWKMLY